MSEGINLQNYPILSTYEVLAAAGITTVDTTTINNGYYGSSPTNTYTGIFNPTGSPSGVNSTNAAGAQTELTQLIVDINTERATLSSQTYTGTSGGSFTFLPGINYNSGSTIIFDTNAVLNFDANNDINASFYITSGTAITFTNVTINLLNGAQACHIYWLAGSTITFTTVPVIYGNLIANTGITFTTTPIINGRIYTTGASVSFSGTTIANAVVCICYVKGTKILTENGYIPIEDLKVDDKVVSKGKIHNNDYVNFTEETLEPIIWCGKFTTSELTDKTNPICIKANALGENSPCEDLYISPGHRILLEGKMVTAESLVNETTIFQVNDQDHVVYYHIELSSHASVITNNVLSESYLDLNTRHIFETQN
jgi:hypothetical protein